MRNIYLSVEPAMRGWVSKVANWEPILMGPRIERHLLVKRARMQGFLVLDYAERYSEALKDLTQWVRQGLIRYREDILEGIEQAPDSIAGLYCGKISESVLFGS